MKTGLPALAELVLSSIGFGMAHTLSAATLYVGAGNLNPQLPYRNWPDAAPSIQEAIAAAAPGDEIIVTNGVYRAGMIQVNGLNRVALTNRVTVRSVNGPGVTVIEGAAGRLRCAYVGTGAVLSGFTLTNGTSGALCESLGILTNCVIAGNAGGGVAGGVLYGCLLRGNQGGGASDGVLYECTLSQNTGGGASGSTLFDCLLANNSASGGSDDGRGNGGGAEGCTLYNCDITGNSVTGGGGGAIGCTLYKCTITGNSADYGGGATEGTLFNCTLVANTAAQWGGGSAGSTLYSCALTGNSAGESGGGASGGKLYNCTVTGNTARSGGGAAGRVGEFFTDLVSLKNCIVYFNEAADGANYTLASFERSCTTPLPAGRGNIDSDPQLLTATHLAITSPCVQAGDPAYAQFQDIDGESWSNPPAIGADQPGTGTGPLTATIAAVTTNLVTGYSVSFIALNTGPVFRTVWDFDDGTLTPNQAIVTHAWSAPGIYSVRLTAYNASYPTGVVANLQVTVSEALRYVNTTSTTPRFPYTNWLTAAVTIQDAIAAATSPGCQVLVTNGVYRSGTVNSNGLNRVALTNGIVVRSVNGPSVTVIEGDADGVRCAYVGDGSMLSGFTLTNGHARGDFAFGAPGPGIGGGAWCEGSGVLSNCVLVGNSSQGVGGGVYSGTLWDCTLAHNSAQQEGGGAYLSTLYRCVLSTNSAPNGGGACDSTLRNCVLTGNTAHGFGGGALSDGAFDCTLYDCVLTGNSAGVGGGVVLATLYNCTLSKNSADLGGGSYEATLYNCVLTANRATEGGGANGGALYNCTVTGNSATTGGGTWGTQGNSGGIPIQLTNCIVYLNHASRSSNYFGGTFAYSCSAPLPQGIGNINADPRFVDPTAGDFQLQPASPCIDQGMDLTGLIATDILGLPRSLDATAHGSGQVDMGAYEFNPYRFDSNPQMTPQGLLLLVKGELGKKVRIDRSRDLVKWEPAVIDVISTSGLEWVDGIALTQPNLFYRAQPVP